MGNVVVIRVDADDTIGGGHAIRCMAITEALVAHGGQVHVFTRCLRPDLVTAFRALGVVVHHLSGDHLGETAADQRLAGAAFVRALRHINLVPDWVLVDHYAITAQWHKAVRESNARVACIDDLGDRVLDCDLIVYPLLSPPDHGYIELTPKHCVRLLGPEFALLSRAYREHAASTSQSARMGPVVVSFGLADPDRLTEKTAAILAVDLPSTVPAVVVAPHTESHDRLAAMNLPRSVEFVGPQPSLAPFLATARLVVGGAGGSSIERLFFRVPTVAVPLVDNQERTAQFLADQGLAIVVKRSSASFNEDLRAALASAIRSPPQFPSNSPRIDGLGAERVAQYLLN